jgi:hypothetical protein
MEGGRIEAGAPLCSVHSQGSNAAATKELLDARVRRLEEALYSGRRDVRNILEWS